MAAPATRRLWTWLHRWVGLVMAAFLVVVGLTGALLAWYEELDTHFAADLKRGTAPAGEQALDPFRLREILLAARPTADLNHVELGPRESLAPVRFRVEGAIDPSTGERHRLDHSEFWADPVTGAVTGDRRYGDISQGMKNLMPFVLELHTSLALGVVGSYWFGIVALLWTIDCFVGAYLTFPLRAARRAGTAERGWWQRWKPAWLLRWRSGAYKLNFDLHRAGGLWLWVMLFVFAWSSVAFNLREVYRPVMDTLFGMRAEPAPEAQAASSAAAAPRRLQLEPGIAWREAHALAQRHMAAALAGQGRRQLHEVSLGYDPGSATFTYAVQTVAAGEADASARSLSVRFDANGGALVGTAVQVEPEPLLGDVITDFLLALHVAGIWGLPYRVFVCLMGLVVAMLSGTGVYIWWKKRKARGSLRSRATAAAGR